MDCNAGMQLGQQLNKDVLMMHGGRPMGSMHPEQDALMESAGMVHVDPVVSAQWAQSFHQQQAMLQQHEMDQAFQQAQHVQRSGLAPGVTPAAVMMNQAQYQHQHAASMASMMNQNAMAAATMGFGMMMPRTQYQPTSVIPALQQQQQQAPVNLASTQLDNSWANQLSQQQWSTDYSQAPSFVSPGQTDQTMEEKTKDSAFYSFMDKVRQKELLIDEEKGEVVAGPGPETAVAEDAAYLENLAHMEGIHMPESLFRSSVDGPGVMADQEAPYVQEMDMGENDVEDWAGEYAEMQERLRRAMNSTDYPFEPNNPYKFRDAPFEEGLEMLQLGNLAEAALAFEAVCQQDPENEKAWQLLGTTQAENEKEGLAILALNNARKLNPRNLTVHTALSVSHTNERNADAAMDSLKAWLVNNPEYEHLGSITIEPDPELDIQDTFFFADPTRMREVMTLYNAAIEMNPTDSHLFINLGVLHNVAHDFEKAAECFQRAVELHPDDAQMWNKLGATLANGGHPERALEAYNRALDINPGYVRAMYNMAVSYSNMSQYPLAARHMVKAIASQQGGTNPTGEGSRMATQSMWELLRMALSLMDRQDLVELTHEGDLTPFVKEFGLEGHV